MIIRIVASVLWFLAVDLVLRMVVGGFVGYLTFCNAGFQDCVEVGRAASLAFFEKYNPLVVFGGVGLTALLSVNGVLPGTAATRKR